MSNVILPLAKKYLDYKKYVYLGTHLFPILNKLTSSQVCELINRGGRKKMTQGKGAASFEES